MTGSIEMKKIRKKGGKPNLADLLPKELEDKIRKLQIEIDQMQEMKKILRESGMKPDDNDKERESRLIAKLVRLEKQLKFPTGKPTKEEKDAKKKTNKKPQAVKKTTRRVKKN